MSNLTCSRWPDEVWKCRTLEVVIKTFASLSLVGSFLVVVFMLLTKKYKLTLQKIVFAMAWTTLVFGVAQLLSKTPLQQSALCITQGFLINFCEWLLLGWLILITLTILFKINKWNSFLSDYFKSVCSFICVFCLAIACLPLIDESYGPADIWCWITSKGMRLGGWIVPFLLIMCIVILLYAYIIYKVYKGTTPSPGETQQEESINHRYRKEVKKLLAYPFTYLILYLPITILGITNMYLPYHMEFVLAIFALAFTSSIGLVNSLLYLILLTKREELTFASLQQSWRKLRFGDNYAVENNVQVAEETVFNP